MREKEFYEKSTSEIEANLYNDILIHQDKKFKTILLILIVVAFLFRWNLSYWIKFGLSFPSSFSSSPINVIEDPIQINYTEEESNSRTFIYTSLINKSKIKIIPMAYYKLSGMVVAYNNDIGKGKSFFDSAALYDLGAAWGKLADKKYYDSNFKCYSAKTPMYGSRVLWTEARHYDISRAEWEYALVHFSHSHVVPANRNIMSALLNLKRWERVMIEGYLVDMEPAIEGATEHYSTSMSRTDSSWGGDRGNGSCETVYVTKVQVGNRIYQ